LFDVPGGAPRAAQSTGNNTFSDPPWWPNLRRACGAIAAADDLLPGRHLRAASS
jgi:hypothetical protein